MKTILITGINGYLGSNLAKRYSKDYKIIGLEYSLKDLFRLEGSQFEVYASKDGIPDNLFYNHSINGIIHTATFYGRNNESNGQITYANMYLPQLLLEKAIQNNCSFFINTDTVLDRFTSNYALSKKQFRDWLQLYSNLKMIKVINLQLDHFYGPGTNTSNFITSMIQKMLVNETSISLTRAEQNRDFLYIDDLLDVYDMMLEKQTQFNYFEEFNVGTGINSNLKQILEFIKVNTKSSSVLEYGAISYRQNELMDSNNDITKLKELGWSHKFKIEDGLLQVIEFEKSRL